MEPRDNNNNSDKLDPRVPTTGHAASTGDLATDVPPGYPPNDGDNHNSNRPIAGRVSPVAMTHRSGQVETPVDEGGESGTEYFPTLDDSVPPSMLQPYQQQPPANIDPTSTGRRRSTSNVSSSLDDAAHWTSRQPSIRIRRRPSASNAPPKARRFPSFLGGGGRQDTTSDASQAQAGPSRGGSTRRPRSISQPERAQLPQDPSVLARHARRRPPPPQMAMPRLTEEGARPTMEELDLADNEREPEPEPISPVQSLPDERLNLSRNQTEPGADDGPPRLHRMRRMSRMFWPRRQQGQGQQGGEETAQSAEQARQEQEYDEMLVDYLDTVDPEVQTLSTLTNVQNSLFVPDLGKWVNRRPTYNLSEHEFPAPPRRPAGIPPAPSQAPASEQMGDISEDKRAETEAEAEVEADITSMRRPQVERTSTITSRLTDSHYAALPHGATLEGWTEEEKWELDDHVRHMLHSKRAKFKRMMKGFGQYVRRPLGFFITLYATLITLFGLAWVLFLIGWIYVGDSDRQKYLIHIIDSVLVALFAIMGDGLAPFRAVDTYHMIYVIHYARIVKKGGVRPRSRLQKQNIPPDVRQSMELAAAAAANAEAEAPLRERERTRERSRDGSQDDDVESARSGGSGDPHTMRNNIVDAEDAKSGIDAYEDTPLTYKQQRKLYHHQKKLAKSHSFYKPHETATHYAFPLGYLMAIVILLDCHSLLQISLGATTWGINYKTRPFALTTVILCVSITCNITAGIVITVGDRKTRKKDVWKLMNRQELTGDAMRKVEEKRSNTNSSKPDKTTSDSETDLGGLSSQSSKLNKSRSELEKLTKSSSELNKLTKQPS